MGNRKCGILKETNDQVRNFLTSAYRRDDVGTTKCNILALFRFDIKVLKNYELGGVMPSSLKLYIPIHRISTQVPVEPKLLKNVLFAGVSLYVVCRVS
jgi:hypothetical protein